MPDEGHQAMRTTGERQAEAAGELIRGQVNTECCGSWQLKHFGFDQNRLVCCISCIRFFLETFCSLGTLLL